MEMNIKMGNIVKTLVDKRGNWGSTVVFIPKGTLCLVCEVYDNGAISVEAPDSMPFALVDYEKSEYEKVEYFKKS